MIHTIREQSVHVTFNGSEAQAVALQQQLSQLCQDWLIPALERVFNRLSSPDRICSIDRLEIDTSFVNLDQLQNELVRVVEIELERLLRPLLLQQPAVQTAMSGDGRQHSVEHAVAKAFVWFLKTGRLPWFYRVRSHETLETNLLNAWRHAPSANKSEIAQLRVALFANSARMRLVEQFSENFLQTLLFRIDPDLHKTLQTLQSILTEAELTEQATGRRTRRLWEVVYRYVAEADRFEERQLIALIREALPAESMESDSFHVTLRRIRPDWIPFFAHLKPTVLHASFQRKLLFSLRQAFAQSAVATRSVNVFEKQLLLTVSAHDNEGLQTERSLINRAWLDIKESAVKADVASTLESCWPGSTTRPQTNVNGCYEADHTVESNSIPVDPIATEIGSVESPDIEEGIYIDNAGLVLLHPFLPQFFTALNIVVNEKLVQQEKALCLLYFLTSGQTVAPEYELVLPKILCNIPPDRPVSMSVHINLSEREEAEALLKAVIKHWAVLKNTGTEGLRTTFLNRSGKLSRRDDGAWRLQVEHKSFDILMEQLPWGIGMIKLPWMTGMLWVEWG